MQNDWIIDDFAAIQKELCGGDNMIKTINGEKMAVDNFNEPIKPIYPKWYKNHRGDKIYWKDQPDVCGEWVFSFDKKTEYNMFLDYPQNLTPEQKAIFDKENPHLLHLLRTE